MKNHKFIFVIGGVMSGVGKGITTSSIGTIFEAQGYKVNIVKADPYLNVDAGTMNPTEHGEVFVLNSGLETDQDMGNYERFLNRDLSSSDYMTSGMVYSSVIQRERALGYRGKCVEAVPHIRDEIVRRYEESAKANKSDISIIEIGGTVGDYQNVMFIEAARYLKLKHPEDVTFITVTFLPIPGKLGEMKTKPTQNAIRDLQSYGVQTDIVIARSEVPLDAKRKEKIAVSTGVSTDHVISAPDIESIYDVPINFEKDKLGEILANCLNLNKRKTNLKEWKKFVRETKRARQNGNAKKKMKQVEIAIVGKYFDTGDFVLSDSYVSVIEAIKFSAYSLGIKPKLNWINAKEFSGKSERVKKKLKKKLAGISGILVPGGFGESGIEGKINVIKFSRENKIPYFGLCYGMQLLVVEFGRNVAKLEKANTTEIDRRSPHPVIDIMESQKKNMKEEKYGGSMRLGSYPCVLRKGSIAYESYQRYGWINPPAPSAGGRAGGGKISERHRHRYEVNPNYIDKLTKAGLVFSGTSPDHTLMEIAELPKNVHPFFLGTQFHPEFLARPLRPHPLFTSFIRAAYEKVKKK